MSLKQKHSTTVATGIQCGPKYRTFEHYNLVSSIQFVHYSDAGHLNNVQIVCFSNHHLINRHSNVLPVLIHCVVCCFKLNNKRDWDEHLFGQVSTHTGRYQLSILSYFLEILYSGDLNTSKCILKISPI